MTSYVVQFNGNHHNNEGWSQISVTTQLFSLLCKRATTCKLMSVAQSFHDCCLLMMSGIITQCFQHFVLPPLRQKDHLKNPQTSM